MLQTKSGYDDARGEFELSTAEFSFWNQCKTLLKQLSAICVGWKKSSYLSGKFDAAVTIDLIILA